MRSLRRRISFLLILLKEQTNRTWTMIIRITANSECNKLPWNYDHFLFFFFKRQIVAQQIHTHHPSFISEMNIESPYPCLSSPISLSDGFIYSPFYYSLPLETRFLSAEDSRNPDLSLARRLLLLRSSPSLSIRQRRSRKFSGSKRSVNLRTFLYASMSQFLHSKM